MEAGVQDGAGRGAGWDGVGKVVVDKRKEHATRRSPFGLVGLQHGGEIAVQCGADAVETGNGEVVRDAQPYRLSVGEHTQRHGVGGAQHGGELRVRFQQFTSGCDVIGRVVDVPFNDGHRRGVNASRLQN